VYRLWQEHCCCDSRLSILCDMVSKISASDLGALAVDGRCGGGMTSGAIPRMQNCVTVCKLLKISVL